MQLPIHCCKLPPRLLLQILLGHNSETFLEGCHLLDQTACHHLKAGYYGMRVMTASYISRYLNMGVDRRFLASRMWYKESTSKLGDLREVDRVASGAGGMMSLVSSGQLKLPNYLERKVENPKVVHTIGFCIILVSQVSGAEHIQELSKF